MDSDIKVLQDTKHLINRLIEQTCKTSKNYVAFSTELHGCFTSNDITVLSRDKVTTKTIPGPLLDGNQIWQNMCAIVKRYDEMKWILLQKQTLRYLILHSKIL